MSLLLIKFLLSLPLFVGNLSLDGPVPNTPPDPCEQVGCYRG